MTNKLEKVEHSDTEQIQSNYPLEILVSMSTFDVQ